MDGDHRGNPIIGDLNLAPHAAIQGVSLCIGSGSDESY